MCRSRFFPACVALGALLANGACVREGIDSNTLCQFQATNDAWKTYGFNLSISEPSPRNCPVSLEFSGQPVYFAGVVDAPYGTPISPFVFRFLDARNFFIGGGLGSFGLAPNGREAAKINTSYSAGLAGDLTVNQDRLHTEVGVYQSSQNAINDTYLPYTLTRVSVSIARVPRTKVGRATTLRVYPNGIVPSRFEWYLNGVRQSANCNNPWNTAGCGSAFTKTYSAAGTYNWKVVMIWGYPEKARVMTFSQAVDP